ncbi:PAS domain S-box protein [Gemmatimonas groenlandica]|uniref:PAS domain S-box protein n=1 Tax=Gemmatimonas groenlandica TaxID=2732249 RepID=A0A6M4IRP0_9BACT|nr:PAS domain S-box protein [Gemmatimonas groenlandica]QJR36795.1 PAS domain S-box protein [Gemmatimonas groenlandica]
MLVPQLTRRYIISLVAIALLFAANAALVVWQTNRHADSAQLINVAGRQRMLAQRIVALVVWGPLLRNELQGNPAQQTVSLDSLAKELADTHREWRRVHDSLKVGSKALGLPTPSRATRARLDALDGLVTVTDSVVTGVGRALREQQLDGDYAKRAHELVNTRIGYVAAMDHLVGDLAAEERSSVNRLVSFQIVGALLLLGISVLVVRLIIHPTTRAIEQLVTSVQASNSTLEKQSEALERSSTELEAQHLALLQHQDELEHQASELARLHQISDASPDPIVAFHPSGNILYANRAARALSGGSGGAATAQEAIDVLDRESRQLVRETGLPQVIATGLWRDEVRLTLDDGTTRPVRQTLVAHHWPDGSLQFVSSVMQDLSEIRRVQDALVANEARYRTLVDSLAEGVVMQDEHGKIIAWNASAERILGLTGDQLAGRSSYDETWQALDANGHAMAPEAHPIVRARIENMPVDGTRIQVSRADGSRRWLSVNARPIVTHERETPMAAVATFSDITDQLLLAEEHEMLSVLARKTDHAVVMTDADLLVTWVNEAWERMTGYTMSDSLGHRPSELTEGLHTNPATVANLQQALREERSWSGEILNYRRDGSPYWRELSTTALRGTDGRLTGWVSLSHDVTARRDAERERERFAAAVAMATDGIAILGVAGTLEFVNQAFARMHGMPIDQLIGAPWQRVYSAAESLRLAREFGPVVQSVGAWQGEAMGVRAGGESFPQWMSLSQLPNGGQVLVARDITDAKRAEEVLRHQSLHDELTGLYNRRGFMEVAEQQVRNARRASPRCALFYGDLDHFKRINDSYGHDAGDEALLVAANTLRSIFRESDIVARLGGDEFTILAIGISPAAVESLSARLRARLRIDNEARSVTAAPWEVHMSLGVAYFDANDDETLTMALSRADQALYAQKQRRPAQAA